MPTAWESEIAEFLTDLSTVQDQTLDVLSRKQGLLAASDAQGLTALGAEEESLIGRLQGCLDRRQKLLARAAQEGLPADSIRSLSQSLPERPARGDLANRVNLASRRTRLLQHQSLVNWVVVQRTLLHLSQILGIIATGGKMQPTYSRGTPVRSSGALVDREA